MFSPRQLNQVPVSIYGGTAFVEAFLFGEESTFNPYDKSVVTPTETESSCTSDNTTTSTGRVGDSSQDEDAADSQIKHKRKYYENQHQS